MSSTEEIGDRFSRFRKHIKKTQEQLGDELKLGRTSLSQIERGENRVSMPVLRHLISVYDLNPYWLLFGIEPMVVEMDSLKGKQGNPGSNIDQKTKAHIESLERRIKNLEESSSL